TLWPFPDKVFKRLAISDKRLAILVIEMSYGQMLDDVRLAVNCQAPVEFLGRSGGGVPSEGEIINKVRKLLRTREPEN
ncbi:MAG: hypothetical protein H8D90_01460, partial [Candidatus Omnitrophica bacterium]|nr:hypothetical protein [Candidatus Omnitrophota bacterium]